MAVRVFTGARLDAETITRLERVAVELGKRAAGIPVDRSEALRATLLRGLCDIERELGLAASETVKP